MNSGVPGSPRKGGPPFHAYQYVRREPSASRLVIELMPLSLTRMFCHPSVESGTIAWLFGRAGRCHRNREFPACGVEFDARNVAGPARGVNHCADTLSARSLRG